MVFLRISVIQPVFMHPLYIARQQMKKYLNKWFGVSLVYYCGSTPLPMNLTHSLTVITEAAHNLRVQAHRDS